MDSDTVDFKGRPALRSGIHTNLITYLTAAENVNIWSGTASLLPLADSFLGRYRTIMLASLLYILVCYTLHFLIIHINKPTSLISPITCRRCPCSLFHLFFLTPTILLSLSCCTCTSWTLQAFGAHQFDPKHPHENKARSSFFNWCYFTFSAALLLTIPILTFIQDNVGWVLGFGIPCIVMLLSLLLFSFGTWTYRFTIQNNQNTPFFRIGRVFLVALHNCRATPSPIPSVQEAPATLSHPGSQQFRYHLHYYAFIYT